LSACTELLKLWLFNHLVGSLWMRLSGGYCGISSHLTLVSSLLRAFTHFTCNLIQFFSRCLNPIAIGVAVNAFYREFDACYWPSDHTRGSNCYYLKSTGDYGVAGWHSTENQVSFLFVFSVF